MEIKTLQELALEFKKRDLCLNYSDFNQIAYSIIPSEEEYRKILGLSVLLNVPFQEHTNQKPSYPKRYIFAVNETSQLVVDILKEEKIEIEIISKSPLQFKIKGLVVEDLVAEDLNKLITKIKSIEDLCLECGFKMEGKLTSKKLVFSSIIPRSNNET